jgi:dTDP-4-dehydrorhamnose 3,5-epimerase
MRLAETPIPGVLMLEADVAADDRGYFCSRFSSAGLAERGITFSLDQAAFSYNAACATLRGMHFQAEPHPQAKVVYCQRGRLYDVVVDVRTGSPTRHRWFGLELSADNRQALYIPPGIAHGFLTLEEATEIAYLISGRHARECERGLRWDDPVIGIRWPCLPGQVSERDRTFALLSASD